MENTNDFFKFGLYLNDEPIMEEIFDRTFIPKEINLKSQANDYIKTFKKALSLRNNQLKSDNNLKTNKALNSYKENLKFFKFKNEDSILVRKSEGEKNEEGFYENPEENFKFVLFNVSNQESNIVIERNFYITYFNPNTRFSTELTESFRDVVADIKDVLKKRDINFLYDYFENPWKHKQQQETVIQ